MINATLVTDVLRVQENISLFFIVVQIIWRCFEKSGLKKEGLTKKPSFGPYKSSLTLPWNFHNSPT